MANMAIKPIDILLVEDNAGDARLTTEALRDGKVNNRISIARDGVEALAYLRREAGFADATRPDVILLDLNLPKKNGHEVLAEIKADPDLKRIPVVILTTSKADEDIIRSYNLHANCFVNKPVGLEQFMAVVLAIESFWFTVVKLPPN